MQTHFTAEQLSDPHIADSNSVLRKCVHCGFCTATCPTYVLLGNELDSPRGRIYLIKEMLEKGEPATKETVKHVDRCLSCLSCMTTCPSGVNYMHLVDHARVHIENTYNRPYAERFLRNVLAFTMPRPALFRFSLIAAKLVSPFKFLRHLVQSEFLPYSTSFQNSCKLRCGWAQQAHTPQPQPKKVVSVYSWDVCKA
jgi:glycolate oxidase iron-sulfur subunit